MKHLAAIFILAFCACSMMRADLSTTAQPEAGAYDLEVTVSPEFTRLGDDGVVEDQDLQTPPDQPDYPDMVTACREETKRQTPVEHRSAVLAYCEHRTYHSSRYKTIKSRVDGTPIHDRDRPTSWIFWTRAWLDGTLDPNCEYHQIEKLPHPPACRKLAYHWPFKDVVLPRKARVQWMAHSHDFERFGAQGPHDWNVNAYRYKPGCWPMSDLWRNDVAAELTVMKATRICEHFGRCTKGLIKANWRKNWPDQ